MVLLFTVYSFSGCFADTKLKHKPETVVTQDVLVQSLITEKSINQIIIPEKINTQNIIYQDYVYQCVINEDIISESRIFEIYIQSTDEDYLLSQLPIEIQEYDIDWQSVISEFAIGTTILVVAGALTISSAGTPIYYFFASGLTEIVKETLISGVLGAVLNCLSAHSLEDLYVNAKKYIIEGFADGYMWGAISGVLLNATVPQKKVIPKQLYNNNDVYASVIDDEYVYDIYNNLMGYIISSSDDLYLADRSGKIINSIDDFGNIVDDIPTSYNKNISKIKANGRYSCNFGVDDGYVLSENVKIGQLNQAGQIIGVDKYEGQLLGCIDESGKLIENNYRAAKAGFVFDNQGCISNKMQECNNISLFGGAQKTVEYLDSNNNVIGYTAQYVDSENVERLFLMSNDNSVVGILSDIQHIEPNWNVHMSSMAASGVNNAKHMTVSLIDSGVIYDYGPSIDDAVKSYIKENHKMPNNLLQGHHINNVANYPWLANDPNNIVFYNHDDHLNIGHSGNFQNSSNGMLTQLNELFCELFTN